MTFDQECLGVACLVLTGTAGGRTVAIGELMIRHERSATRFQFDALFRRAPGPESRTIRSPADRSVFAERLFPGRHRGKGRRDRLLGQMEFGDESSSHTDPNAGSRWEQTLGEVVPQCESSRFDRHRNHGAVDLAYPTGRDDYNRNSKLRRNSGRYETAGAKHSTGYKPEPKRCNSVLRFFCFVEQRFPGLIPCGKPKRYHRKCDRSDANLPG